jgi:phytoene synthase
VRLQWWRDTLSGAGQGDAAGNPIAAALLETVRRFDLPIPALLDLIDAHTFDLYDEPMATSAALENYGAATSGMTIGLAARILNDGVPPGHEALFRHAGIACSITGVLQRLAVHSARGQRFLPDDLLAKHGIVAADVLARRASRELRSVLQELRDVVRSHLAVLKDEAGIPARLLPALLPVSLLAGTLQRMETADPFHPADTPQWRRQWTLWRAARKPRRFISVRRDGPAGSGDRQ